MIYINSWVAKQVKQRDAFFIILRTTFDKKTHCQKEVKITLVAVFDSYKGFLMQESGQVKSKRMESVVIQRYLKH